VLLLSEDEAADERAEAEHLLESRGFGRYEVSNYCLPGQASLHNLAYWRMKSYLGAGPGAVSTVIGRREPGSAPSPGRDGASLRLEEARSCDYGPGAARGAGVGGTETLVDARDSAFEAVMMGFRTAEGLDRWRFEDRFGLPVDSLLGSSFGKWRARLVDRGARIALDPRGLDLLNGFLVDCLAELERSFPAGQETSPARALGRAGIAGDHTKKS
jgi:oxygen-independent coproporphyrinogen-3 oxidase